ncbi:hypothetical protein [Pseudonocardia sp. GCM10023141]|uniref:hypothetical protein n=1 Tax=Pseudonocardia sp. GCM10023141 TaxID=3252653 RepID=UPI003621B982
MEAEFLAVVHDAEVVVLDDDGDGLAGMSAPDAQPLAGHHDHAVDGDAALEVDRAGGRRR